MSPPELYYNSINIILLLFRTVGQSHDATFNFCTLVVVTISFVSTTNVSYKQANVLPPPRRPAVCLGHQHHFGHPHWSMQPASNGILNPLHHGMFE